MPKEKDREYRDMSQPLYIGAATKRFQSDHYVEGFATTFDTPYVMYEWDGIKYYEVVDRQALVGADMTDVIMQYDHAGTVYARNKMSNGKPPCLLIEPQERGLFIAADLGVIAEAKNLYASIEAGLVYKMSWAFRVMEDAYKKETRTRTILKIKKVYDVSAVSYPANGDTDIAARSYFNGVIEVEKREALARQKQLLLLKTKI
jgi:HK97 family phage prohead protease